jgi:hypothetical protein
MKPVSKHLTLVLAAAILLGGCQARTILDMNRDLTELHQRKLEIEQQSTTVKLDQVDANGMSLQVARADVDQRLTQLAGDAAQAAEAEADPLNAIALYRIAAVAAWQSGRPDADVIAQAGLERCQAHPQGLNVKPRDCALLLLVPDLAANDELVERYEPISNQRTPDMLPEFQQIFDSFVARVDGLAAAQSQIAPLDLPPDFLPAVKGRTFVVACNAANVAFAIDMAAGGPATADAQQAAAEIDRLETVLNREISLDRTCPRDIT